MKTKQYYKFFNKNECHYGFKYKTGLNVDTIPFNHDPAYECGEGGLYFSDAVNIMNFIDLDMAYIREVEVPEGYRKVHIKTKTKYRAHSLNLLEKHKLSDVKTWQWMIDQNIDITAGDNDAIRWASGKGLISIVKFLVEHGVDVTACNNVAIQWASYYRHSGVVKYLQSKGATL